MELHPEAEATASEAEATEAEASKGPRSFAPPRPEVSTGRDPPETWQVCYPETGKWMKMIEHGYSNSGLFHDVPLAW